MYEKLFHSPLALLRHQCEPYFEERQRFLEHCAREGYTHETMLVIARRLLWVARSFRDYPDLKVSQQQLETMSEAYASRTGPRAIEKPEVVREYFLRTATQWLRYLGCFQEEMSEPLAFADLLEKFSNWMRRERGFSERTIESNLFHTSRFLSWFFAKKQSVSEVSVRDVDLFIAANEQSRWCRLTVRRCLNALRSFFKYAEIQGWCMHSIVHGILSPRVFSQESLPIGPSWQDVQLLLASMETDKPDDIRDWPIAMLFAIYGLRVSEVSMLRLENLDWEQNVVLFRRSKRRGIQSYPLIASLGNAIIRYLKSVRPRCSRREIFLTLTAPWRPLSRGALHGLIRKRMLKLGIQVPHKGPHALRHACATHLLSQGFSLKQIGDHLGHRSSAATQVYAKVDLEGLREVAAFDIGGLR